MAEKAAWLVDHVIPHVANRQWVLTVPWKRRWLLARKPELANELVGIALGVVEAWYREAARAPSGRGGSVAMQQRFGSALNLNVHLHVITLDGDEEVEADADDSLALLHQASLGGYVAVGPRARRQVRRVQTFGGRTVATGPP